MTKLLETRSLVARDHGLGVGDEVVECMKGAVKANVAIKGQQEESL